MSYVTPQRIEELPALDALFAHRALLEKNAAEIARRLAELARADDEAKTWERADEALTSEEGTAIKKWTETGCRGPLPAIDHKRHNEIAAKILEARRKQETSRQAIAHAETEARHIDEAIHLNAYDRQHVVALAYAKEFEAAGERAGKLRAELEALETRLEDGLALFKRLAENELRDTPREVGWRNPYYHQAERAAIDALTEEGVNRAQYCSWPRINAFEAEFLARVRGGNRA